MHCPLSELKLSWWGWKGREEFSSYIITWGCARGCLHCFPSVSLSLGLPPLSHNSCTPRVVVAANHSSGHLFPPYCSWLAPSYWLICIMCLICRSCRTLGWGGDSSIPSEHCSLWTLAPGKGRVGRPGAEGIETSVGSPRYELSRGFFLRIF